MLNWQALRELVTDDDVREIWSTTYVYAKEVSGRLVFIIGLVGALLLWS